ncbi:MAG: hypothetical protein ABI402_11510 [Ferruginibacter sp.]
MRYKISILNITSYIFIVIIIFYSIFKYNKLSEGEGWGIVAMFGSAGIPVVLLILDFIIQQIFKDRVVINIIGAFLVVAVAICILLN